MTFRVHQKILSACFNCLVPIARVLLINGIGYREFDEVCRRAFIKTASSEFGVRGRETNASRVAAITGIPRKEVQKIRQFADDVEGESTALLSPLADLLSVWATSSKFLDSQGLPRELSVGDESSDSFSDLVRQCMGDVPPGAVRAELSRLGVVENLGRDRVRLVRRTLIPPDVEDRLQSAIHYSLRGLAESIAHNNDPSIPAADRFFERFVESRRLSEDEIGELRIVVRKCLVSFSEELDATLNEGSHNDASGRESLRRVGVGIFYTEESEKSR